MPVDTPSAPDTIAETEKGYGEMRTRRTTGALVLAVTMLVATSASGQSAEVVARVRSHDEAAHAHFEAERYGEALAAMVDAQAALPDERRLFNMARCHEELGHSPEAIDLYRRYADSADVSGERRDEARERADTLRAALRQEDAAEETPSPTRRGLAPTAFWSMIGVTAASTLTWVALATASAVVDSRHEEAASLSQMDRFERLGDLGPKLTTAADITLGVALTSAIVTLILGLLTNFDTEEMAGDARRPSLRLGATRNGAAISLAWTLGL